MTHFKVVSVILGVSLLVSACQSSPLLTAEEEMPTPTEEAVEIVYDADYALKVCGERPVDLFDPSTGHVECAQWLPSQVVADEGEQAEVDSDEVVGLPQESPGTSTVIEVFRSTDALEYPEIEAPNASRQVVFPDIPHGGRPALVAYEVPFEDGDFCDNTPCGMDVPQYYFRVMTAGKVIIPDLGVSCVATPTKGCLVIVINHFGPTAMYRGNTIDHGFTVAGRVWDMGTPNDVTAAGQALLDHYVHRMSGVPDGANCGTIDACETIEWHLVIIGNGEVQTHWSGLFRR